MKKINRPHLASLDACTEGLAEFTALFGDAEVEINLENCLRINPEYVYWFASVTLNREAFRRYAELWEDAVTRQWLRLREVTASQNIQDDPDATDADAVIMRRTESLAAINALFKSEISNTFLSILNENEND